MEYLNLKSGIRIPATKVKKQAIAYGHSAYFCCVFIIIKYNST